MDGTEKLVVFFLEGRRYGLPLDSVERVVHAVEITPLPAGPPELLGVIDVEGVMAPVVDIRKLFGLPGRELDPSDRIVIAAAARGRLAFVVDEVGDLVDAPALTCGGGKPDRGGPPAVGRGAEALHLEDGMIFLFDPELLFHAAGSREGKGVSP